MFDGIMKIIGWPLGWLMWLMYQFVSNYGVALILFTIASKIMMIPLSIKQQQSTIKMQILQPKINELQTKYKNNQTKLNEEVQALYQRENYSMFSGCLPMLIQFPILFGLLDVVYKPLTHLLRIGADTITALADIVTAHGTTITGYTRELVIFRTIKENPEWFDKIGSDVLDHVMSLDLTFLGLDLSVNPGAVITMSPSTWMNPIIIIPILSGITALIMSLVTQKNSSGSTGNNSMMMGMTLMMPIMSLVFTFTLPAGAGFYWTISNTVGAIQAVVLNKFWNPKEIAEKMKAEDEARRALEREEKIEAKKRAKENGEESLAALSQKELNRKKLQEARRRSAEKYGDSYEDVTDDDLK